MKDVVLRVVLGALLGALKVALLRAKRHFKMILEK